MIAREGTQRGVERDERGGGGEDGGGGGEETVKDEVPDNGGEEEGVSGGGVGAFQLGEGPEVSGGVGEEEGEGKLELAEALARDGAGAAVGPVIRAVGDHEEDLDQGLDLR